MNRFDLSVIAVLASGCASFQQPARFVEKRNEESNVADVVAANDDSAQRERIELLGYLEFANPVQSNGRKQIVTPDPQKRHDLYCRIVPDEPVVFRNCKILGFTDQRDPDKKDRHSAQSLLSSKSANGPWIPPWFQYLLVLEYPDGRLAYIPHDCVKHIEEASARRDFNPQPTDFGHGR